MNPGLGAGLVSGACGFVAAASFASAAGMGGDRAGFVGSGVAAVMFFLGWIVGGAKGAR